ncbi:MAG: outer membrane-stress sensor serine endopeptidase DegS [Succinivibrionaceae bacterium]|jgi:serine protease DegS|nr:outer membrane-stress sensor serine endopeptidase DegS [Succinivibrionaceae bacterium]MBQ1427087.1 outer membrane-stress sensor serine endopeptidase DegS [Succinivibrionaceae bacterium]MBQ8976005.1 outer membrane-stress sensor serine endopeptidase DegS [Succinivibrionaceae bacterium]
MKLFKYIFTPVLIGIVLFFILICVFPSITNNTFSLPYIFNRLLAPASYHDAVVKAAPSVVNVYTKSLKENSETGKVTLEPNSLGSGVIMHRKGYILTNYHVVADSQQIIVALQDGRILDAELIGVDKLTDMAVLKITADNLKVIPQNDKRVSNVGDVVLAIGNPFNVGQTVTQGIISAKGRSGLGTMGPNSNGRQDLLQTDAYVGFGNSGGALINTLGELVGINSGTYQSGNDSSSGNNIAFAVPYKLAKRIMYDLIKNGRVVRGYLGIKTIDIDPVTANLMNLGGKKGLIIQGIDPEGPAAKGGLQSGDIVIKIEEQAVINAQTAMDIIAETKPGSVIEITVLRDGVEKKLKVTVAEDLLH